MNTLRIIGAVLMLATLSASGDRDAVAKGLTAPVIANAARTQVGQSFELSVNSKLHKMDVDRPRQEH